MIYCSNLLFFNGKHKYEDLTHMLQQLKVWACPKIMIKPGSSSHPIILLLLASSSIFFCSSCLHKTYFFSPLQANTSSYQAMPVRSDSLKSAIYADGSFSAGGLNQGWRDGVYAFRASMHRSHVIENFRLYYGASIILGEYNVKPNDYLYYNAGSYNSIVGTKSFGAYGFNAGFSFTVPLGRKGEWRFLGVEGSLFKEFGDYYNFRKSLPDSAANIIERNQHLGSLGINTELIFKGRSNNKFGIKFAGGSYLHYLTSRGDGSYYNTRYPDQRIDLVYFSNTYHFTVNKVTAFFQLNIGTQAGHFQAGINYRL